MKINSAPVIWLTGLSASGKTTLATSLVKELRDLKKKVIFLDGDELREIFNLQSNKSLDHNLEDRLTLAKKYSQLCNLISKQEVMVVIATISLFREIHVWNRENIHNYFEIYLKVPIEVLKQRDPKKIYERYYSGKLKNVAGLDLPIDEPENSDLIIAYNHSQNTLTITLEIMNQLKLKGFI
jgi:adenylylsulfate kinase